MKRLLLIPVLTLAALTTFAKGETTSAEQESAKISSEWKEIEPSEIDVNAVKMFAEDWMLLSAGKEGKMNMMTIAWGGLGELWGKPVVTVYVSTSRYTNQFMQDNEHFTVTAFPDEYRQKLGYMGSVSGRNEDKVKGSGLTPEFTELGNPIYKEGNLAIECKKLYAHPFDKELMPQSQREWYDKNNLGVHVMYIGEIVHVWKK